MSLHKNVDLPKRIYAFLRSFHHIYNSLSKRIGLSVNMNPHLNIPLYKDSTVNTMANTNGIDVTILRVIEKYKKHLSIKLIKTMKIR